MKQDSSRPRVFHLSHGVFTEGRQVALHCGWLAFLGSGLPRPVSQLLVGPALVFLSPWTHLFVASTYRACPLSTRALQACMSSGEPAPGEQCTTCWGKSIWVARLRLGSEWTLCKLEYVCVLTVGGLHLCGVAQQLRWLL